MLTQALENAGTRVWRWLLPGTGAIITCACVSVPYCCVARPIMSAVTSIKESSMTNRIGNKDVAQQRSKADKKRIKQDNIIREASKKAAAKALYRNEVKGRPSAPS